MNIDELEISPKSYGKAFNSYNKLIQRDYILKDKIREYARSIVDDDLYNMGCVYDVNGTLIRRESEELLDNDN